MTEPGNPPTDAAVADWVGKDAYTYWERITQTIRAHYPGIFSPEWLYGGKKHGWSLRFRKNKSFCTLIPEKDRFALLIVFGKAEREKVEAVRTGLSEKTRMEYDRATTFHDGKWLLLAIDSDRVVQDVMLLFAAKRRPVHNKEA